MFDAFRLSAWGAAGGGQGGYNWQIACVSFSAPLGVFTHVTQRLPWFGSLRGRIGWTNGPALYYLTGGWAYGQVITDYAVQIGPPLDSHSFSQILSGWAVGGGLETQISGSWTAKVEYRYMDLGGFKNSFVYAPNPQSNYLESGTARNHIARVGLNYKFGDPFSESAAHSEPNYEMRSARGVFN